MTQPESRLTLLDPQSLDARPSNFPRPATSFVGRDAELRELAKELTQTQLLTLTGTGGAGKTRLALQLAASTRERFEDGTWWLDLAPLSDPVRVAEALLGAMGLRTSVGLTQLQVASAYLAGREALLLFDNCEHVLEEIAPIAATLLDSCPRVTILATSRAPLGLPGETTWRVPSLSLPRPEPECRTVAALGQSEAVRLFVDRARKVRQDFALRDETGPVVARICRELDGIPLAVELAAARVRMLTVQQIAAGLGDRFRLLTGSVRTAPRHQTLRASVEWSHDLLSTEERILLRRLGVFAGGFTLEAVERVAGGDGLHDPDVFELLTSLVDQSLVMVEEQGPVVRYRLLETLRHYALERLVEAAELERVRDHHRDFFLELAERAAPELEHAGQLAALELLDADSTNLAAALERACASNPDMSLRLAIALTVWWRLRGRFSEADAAYARALSMSDADARLLASAGWGRAYCAAASGAFDVAVAEGFRALKLAEEAAEIKASGRALTAIGTAEMFRDPASACAHLERAITLARAARDEPGEVAATQVLATTYTLHGDLSQSERLLADLEPIERQVGNPQMAGYRDWLLGSAAHLEGRCDRAATLFARSRQVAQDVGDAFLQALVDRNAAMLEMQRGNGEAALARLLKRLEGIMTEGAGAAWPALVTGAGLIELSCGHPAAARDRLEGLIDVLGGDDPYDVGWACVGLAHAYRVLGEPAAADAAARRGLDLADSLHSSLLLGEIHLALSRLAAARGDWGGAEQHALAVLDICAERGALIAVPNALHALAEIAVGRQSLAEAAGLLAAAGRGMRQMQITATWVGDDDRWPRLADELRDTLGREGFDAAWGAGQELDLEQAIAWARRGRGERKRPAVGWEALTPTEQRVAELTAQGLTNSQIGAQMFVARSTVKTHLERIYAKLGIHSRAELSAEASRRRAAV